MKTKEIVGAVIVTVGVGGLFYLFFGYIKPRIDFAKENKQ